MHGIPPICPNRMKGDSFAFAVMSGEGESAEKKGPTGFLCGIGRLQQIDAPRSHLLRSCQTASDVVTEHE